MILTLLQPSSIGAAGMNGYLECLSTTVPPFVMILRTVTLEGLTNTWYKTLHFSLDKISERVSINIFNDLSPYSFTTIDYEQTDDMEELIIKSRLPSIKCVMHNHRCCDAKYVNYQKWNEPWKWNCWWLLRDRNWSLTPDQQSMETDSDPSDQILMQHSKMLMKQCILVLLLYSTL